MSNATLIQQKEDLWVSTNFAQESLLYLTKEPSLCINPPNFPKQYDPLHPTPTLTNMILISMPIDQSSTGSLRCQVEFSLNQ